MEHRVYTDEDGDKLAVMLIKCGTENPFWATLGNILTSKEAASDTWRKVHNYLELQVDLDSHYPLFTRVQKAEALTGSAALKTTKSPTRLYGPMAHLIH